MKFTDRAWLEVTLLEAVSEEPFEEWAYALLGYGPKALADDVGKFAQAVVGHELFVRPVQDRVKEPIPVARNQLDLSSGIRCGEERCFQDVLPSSVRYEDRRSRNEGYIAVYSRWRTAQRDEVEAKRSRV